MTKTKVCSQVNEIRNLHIIEGSFHYFLETVEIITMKFALETNQTPNYYATDDWPIDWLSQGIKLNPCTWTVLWNINL